jgi:NitT/TauT family transport system substrate-binding protein
MKKQTKFISFVVAMALIMSLVACVPSATDAKSDEDQLQIVKVAFDNAPSEAGIILGDKLGFFEQQGIQIDYVEFNSGADELSSIASNQVDVSRGIINAGLFNAANQGIDIKLVADGGHNIPGRGYFQIALKKGLGEKYKSYEDMKGMRIAIASVGSINELFVVKALEKGGLTKDDAEMVVVDSFPDMITAVANGNADATMQIEPLITKGVDQGILEWWKDPDEYAQGEEISVLMYSPNFSQNKDLGNKFMIGYLQGVRAYNDALVYGDTNREEIIDILTKNTFVDSPDIFSRMKPPGLDPNGYVLKEGVINDQKWYMEKNLVKEEADVDKLIDNSYVENALKVLKEYTKGE